MRYQGVGFCRQSSISAIPPADVVVPMNFCVRARPEQHWFHYTNSLAFQAYITGPYAVSGLPINGSIDLYLTTGVVGPYPETLYGQYIQTLQNGSVVNLFDGIYYYLVNPSGFGGIKFDVCFSLI